ncbi:bifunctional folylpolyglutamate synthase/dihydrofolate synthase [Paracoccaceae bacterium GXU_MW_L88]
MSSDAILERLTALHPKLIDLSLDRMHRILAALGNPERSLPPVIHIAGTNGKGSTLAMIRAGLEAEGKSVHAYTSPHLARFHERISLGGAPIDEDALSDLLAEVETANAGQDITFFEVTTAAAFLAFSRVPANYLLLEVGLGGRLDATNVITPELSVITPVSLDHQSYLGDTLTEIAGEKAGILKPNVSAVISRQPSEARDAIEARADAVSAPLIMEGQDWQVREEAGRLIFQDLNGLLDLPLPALIGAHQVENAGTALAALRKLGFGEAAAEGAMTATWPARMQRLTQGPLTHIMPKGELWLDGGHNPAAGAALAEALSRLPARDTVLICGMIDTKDIAGFLAPLKDAATRLIAVDIPDAPASLPAETVAKAAHKAKIEASTAPSLPAALRHIIANEGEIRAVICGSLYLAGHVLKTNG